VHELEAKVHGVVIPDRGPGATIVGVSELPDELAARVLRDAGLRVTPQRQAIFACVREGDGHLTADEVHQLLQERVPGLARATVFNALNDLVEAGLLQRVDVLGGPARYDRNLDEEHQHFRCLSCRGLFDVRPRPAPPLDLAEPGFAVHRVRMVIEGLCPACAGPATA